MGRLKYINAGELCFAYEDSGNPNNAPQETPALFADAILTYEQYFSYARCDLATGNNEISFSLSSTNVYFETN